jgi:hypothetical protein
MDRREFLIVRSRCTRRCASHVRRSRLVCAAVSARPGGGRVNETRNGGRAAAFAFGTAAALSVAVLPRLVAPAQAGAEFGVDALSVDAARTSLCEEERAAKQRRKDASRVVSVQCQARDRSGTRPAVAIARFEFDFALNYGEHHGV